MTPLLIRPLIFLLLLLGLLSLSGDAVPVYPVHAGLRASRGMHFSTFPDARYFESAARTMASSAPRARPALIWIVGLYWKDGTVGLSFPAPGGPAGRRSPAASSRDPFVRFHTSDLNESYLSHFDRCGVNVWLQVEPGNADVEGLIDLVLGRYGRHPCVVGFGIDAEWFHPADDKHGRPVTDDDALRWNRRVKSHNPRFRLFLKHYRPRNLPRTVREDILFINDSQGFPNLDALAREFRAWGRRFAPAEVGFQFGYPKDRPWWRAYRNPSSVIANTLAEDIHNARWFFWVDFTAREVFPGKQP